VAKLNAGEGARQGVTIEDNMLPSAHIAIAVVTDDHRWLPMMQSGSRAVLTQRKMPMRCLRHGVSAISIDPPESVHRFSAFALHCVAILGARAMHNRPIQDLVLRDVVEDDLPLFFDFQLDPDANFMAAFTARDPTNREAFIAHWNRILVEPTTINQTILCDGLVVGSVASYEESGKPEVTYWIGRAHWGKGIATRALTAFLAQVNTTRPIFARVAKDNLGSRKVLEKCGFQVIGEMKGFANARGEEIEELLLQLLANK
jgi:RimJ/RimL family protein N-acetyltransferase